MRNFGCASFAGASALAIVVASIAPAHAAPNQDDGRIEALTREVEDLKAIVHLLQDQMAKAPPPATAGGASAAEVESLRAQVRQLQDQLAKTAPTSLPVTTASAPSAETPPAETPAVGATTAAKSPKVVADLLRGITVNALLDGYYEYNFNHPIGRVNYLRAYDVSSNNFSLNQADLVVESAADPSNGKRYGMRVDLQYGQATSTLQGNPANELRPDVYRAVYQAYGTYVFPLSKGLTVDFGKWASSLGYEGNYTKDQLNYSRSYWFDYLPFYHMGLRAKYAFTDQVAFNFWVTNGTEQTEAFNNFKDQLYGVVLTPTPTVSWTLNYYRGQEHPDVTYLQNPTPAQEATLPNQQGTYIEPIPNPPNGLLNIGDTYASWQVTPAFLVAAEADYVTERYYSYSPAQRVYGGAVYAAYQISSKFALAARGEYLADHGGLFSGVTQNVKEGTLTFDYHLADQFLVRTEFRRDWSDHPYFLTKNLGVLTAAQPTLGIGLVWWFGQKEGAW